MDYDMETQSEIKKINNSYENKKLYFIKKFQQKIQTTMKNLCDSMDVDYQSYLYFKNPFSNKNSFDYNYQIEKKKKLKELEDKYNAQYNDVLRLIENERINIINEYKKQRDFKKVWV